MHRYSCHETDIRVAEQIVPESDAKPIHGAVQSEGDHQHHCRLCQLRIYFFEVVYRAGRANMVDIFADNPQEKISASTSKKEGWPRQELFGVR